MKIVVVTASIGEKRNLLTPVVLDRDVDYLCFTDRKFKHPTWKTINVRRNEDVIPVRDAKRYKVLVHEFIEADFSIWIDRHCQLKESVVGMVNELIAAEADIGLVHHPRRCIYHEARTCKQRLKDSEDVINAQVAQYRSQGWPPRAGLFYGGFVVRRHTDDVRAFNGMWWDEIEKWSKRDQLSLPVCLAMSGIKAIKWPADEVHRFFRIRAK